LEKEINHLGGGVVYIHTKIEFFKQGRWHNVFILEFGIYPRLLIASIFEQIRKGLKYRQAITLKNPYWNGKEWVEFFDNIPF
jgi:hypothetical protein